MKNMKRYVALLRGINVSGKNKVFMPALKEGFEQLAFEDVKTYLNSGNVIFSSHEDDIKKLTNQIELMIHNQFHLDISVFVISKQDLLDIYTIHLNGGAIITKIFMIILFLLYHQQNSWTSIMKLGNQKKN